MSNWATPPEYLSILPKIRVLLLGSYHKTLGLPILQDIQNKLIQNGILNCRITKDFDSPPRMPNEPEKLYELRKSEYWLRHADIFVFVFLPEVDNASVGIELNTVLSQMPGNAWRTILAYHEHPPSLVAGLGIRFQPEISIASFKSYYPDLKELLNGSIIRLLDRLYFSIFNRPDGEWERVR